jgi:hypothetical protein
LDAVLRWTDGNDRYKAYINGTSLVVQKRVGGSYTTLGTALSAKAWIASRSEPVIWMVTATDSSLASGLCGLRIQLQSGVSATVTSFLATATS